MEDIATRREGWWKMNTTSLGRSDLQVPRLGVGAMTWGDPSGLARWTPATLAYGGAHGFDEEQRALEVSLEAGVTLFDTAEMYNGKSPAQVALRWLIENE